MLSLLDYDASRCILQTVRSWLRQPSPSGSKFLGDKWSRSMGADPVLRSISSAAGTIAGEGPAGSQHRQPHMTGMAALMPLSPVQPSGLSIIIRSASSSKHGTQAASSEIPIYRSEKATKSQATEDSHPPLPPITGMTGKTVPSSLTPSNVEAFRHARPFEEIPGPTAIYQSIPFAGTRMLYYPFSNEKTDDMGSMLSRQQATFGPIMRVRVGSQWIVLIENINDIQHVIQAFDNEMTQTHKPAAPSKSSPLNRLTAKPTKDIVMAVLDLGTRPQKLRNAVSKYLNGPAVVSQYQPRQEQMATDLTRLLELMQHSPQEVQCLLSRYSVEVCGDLCFSQRMGLLGDHYLSNGEKQKLVESYRTVIRCLGEIQTGTRVFYTFIDDPFAKRLHDARKIARTWERQQMRETTMKAIREKGVSTLMPEERSLFISLLDDKSLTEEEIADTMHALMTAYSAGMSSALQMLLYSLATNVDKQEKLVTDIVKVLGPEGNMKTDTLKALPFLVACLRESARVHYPLASGGQIILSKNIVLSNYLVECGTPIEVNSRRTVKNPLWFDHPHFFLPERWLSESAKNIPRLATLPFGFGDHHCKGLMLFMGQALSAAVIKILQRYKVDLPEEYQTGQVATVHTPFRVPKEPFPFIFSPRSAVTSFRRK